VLSRGVERGCCEKRKRRRQEEEKVEEEIENPGDSVTNSRLARFYVGRASECLFAQ
jgi:hypothetical protein